MLGTRGTQGQWNIMQHYIYDYGINFAVINLKTFSLQSVTGTIAREHNLSEVLIWRQLWKPTVHV